MNWQQQLREMKLGHIKKMSPGFFELSGGDKMKIKPYVDSHANGLTRCIIDWITFKGGSAVRISSQGQARKLNDKWQWTRGSTRNGVADVHAIFRGRHLSIEVKVGKDRMSEAQIKERVRVEAAGGLYFVARDMRSFVEWFNNV